VISVLGHETDLDTTVDRAAVEVAELFSVDMVLLMLGSDDALTVEGHWGVREADIPAEPFAFPAGACLTAADPVSVGPADEFELPAWLDAYAPRHVSCAKLMVGEGSHGLMLLVRRADEPFEHSDQKELRAVAYRIALAIENGLLHRRMRSQLEKLHRLQELTSELTGTLELETIGARVAAMLVDEVPVARCTMSVDRGGELVRLSSAGAAYSTGAVERFPLEASGKTVGSVAVTGAPPVGSDARELLLHILGLTALALDKALLYETSQELARRDSLTGLLGHRVFQEQLEQRLSHRTPFSVVLIDIDDFKQINDLHGHNIGDDALRQVADALRDSLRDGDTVFRIGGEEFCAVLPGLEAADAYAVAERLREAVHNSVSVLPVTVSLGLSTFPEHADERDTLLAHADAALYASKRSGKNRTTIAGGTSPEGVTLNRDQGLDILHRKDPDTVSHSVQVCILAVEIARRLGVPEERLSDLRTAAKLHDIGKVGVPDSILNKPGPLTTDEFRIIQTHPIVGAEILSAWGLECAALFVRQHHENVDGSGYPDALAGDDIAVESRIIRVADSFVAMTLDRPYRAAMARDEAIEELERCAGTQFDSAVVRALIDV
jgi:diguanylate cyclase (GGDEF)-like protein/putative nucleotidyltransferase with HDIG domain